MNAVTKPKGFLAAGISCGIKRSGKKDLGLIFSKVTSLAYGLFTSNKVKAAPLLVTASHLAKHKARAIIVNSGNANCYTGKRGLNDARAMAVQTAKELKIKASDCLVASTGIIGKPLPMAKIFSTIPALCSKLSKAGARDAALAILTTDTFVKEASKTFTIAGKRICIGAMAKGAGMIFPNLVDGYKHATMLCFVTTDAHIQLAALKKALQLAAADSFNSITVDGCMSTNDMVLILANGQAGNSQIKPDTKEFKQFCANIKSVCLDLAKKIVLDAEGATKFIEISIKRAKSASLAKEAGFAIANSSLFKTACFGENRNIGRVISALGAIGISLPQKQTKIYLSSLKKKNILLEVDLGQGKYSSVVYTCDFSPEYVKINAGYS
jgi:glutamate N-acetyltransferase/amino-acid N-acetyltransferase